MQYRYVGFLLLTIVVLFGESCISNKKHLAYINSLKTTHEQTLNNMTLQHNAQITEANDTIRDMSLRLAERKGENNILLMIRKELRDSINYLQSDIRGLNQQSSSAQQNLSSTISQKNQEISTLKNRLKSVNAALDQHVKVLGTLSGDIRLVLQDLDYKKYNVATSMSDVQVSLDDEFIFNRGSNSRMTSEGLEKLEQLAGIFN
ncbi:MAG: hypothetical protein AAFO94_20490, partial [Bacteroidota bacterium]